MFIEYIFHKIQKCAPEMGFNDKKITSVSGNENFDNLNNMGIH